MTDDYNAALQKRKDAEMFSDVENEERMKQTRSERHKKCLSDFEMDDNVGKNINIKDATIYGTEPTSERESGNKEILAEIQNKHSDYIDKISTRKRNYVVEDDRNNCPTSTKIMKSNSDIIKRTCIKKRLNAPLTETIIVPSQIVAGKSYVIMYISCTLFIFILKIELIIDINNISYSKESAKRINYKIHVYVTISQFFFRSKKKSFTLQNFFWI